MARVGTSEKSAIVAYAFWLLGLVGFCGLHRFYAGKFWTGLLWLLTLGLFGVGQIIDLVLIPGMIHIQNLESRLGFRVATA